MSEPSEASSMTAADWISRLRRRISSVRGWIIRLHPGQVVIVAVLALAGLAGLLRTRPHVLQGKSLAEQWLQLNWTEYLDAQREARQRSLFAEVLNANDQVLPDSVVRRYGQQIESAREALRE